MLTGSAGTHPVRAELEATPMNLSRRSILLIIAIVCFVLSAIGIGFTGFSLTAVGLAAFAGAFLVEGQGFKLG